MKSIVFALALSLFAIPAFAQSVGSDASAGSESQSGAAAQSGSALTFNSEAIRQAPGVAIGSIGTSLASDYCSGAVNSGISIPGGSAAFGKSTRDADCNARRNVERIMQIRATYVADRDIETAGKLRQGAVNIMCSIDDETYAAMAAAGVNCQIGPDHKPVKR